MSIVRSIALSRAPLPAFAVVGIYWGAFAAQAPDLKARIGADDGTFGLALLCGAVGAVSAMWLAPRFDALLGARAMQAAAVLAAVAFLGPGLATDPVAFGAALFLCGAYSGLLDVVMNARVSQIEAQSGRALMNLNHAGFSFAYAASAVCAGFAREAGVDAFWVFAMLGGVTLVLATGMRMALEDGGDDTDAPLAGRGFLRIVFWAGIITMAGFMTENATEAWSALHIERTLDGRAAEGSLGPAILGLTMGVGRLLGHLVTPRGREKATIVGAALVAGAGAVLASQAGSPAQAYVGFAILGFGVSVIAPLAFALVGQLARPRDRALAISRTAVIGYFGFFVGPPAMGFVSEAFGLRASFGMIAVVMFAVPLLLLPLRGARAPLPPVSPAPPASAPQNPPG